MVLQTKVRLRLFHLHHFLLRHIIAVRPRSGVGTIIDMRKSVDLTNANAMDIGQLSHVHLSLKALGQVHSVSESCNSEFSCSKLHFRLMKCRRQALLCCRRSTSHRSRSRRYFNTTAVVTVCTCDSLPILAQKLLVYELTNLRGNETLLAIMSHSRKLLKHKYRVLL